MHNLVEFTGSVFGLLLKQSMLATIAFLLVWSLSLVMRKASPFWHISLWFLVLFRFAIPPDVSTSVNGVSLISRIPVIQQTYQRFQIYLLGDHTPFSFEESAGLVERGELTASSKKTEKTLHLESRTHHKIIRSILIGLWLTGVVISFLIYRKRTLYYRQLTGSARTVTDPAIMNILESWKRFYKLKTQIRIVQSSHPVSPFTMGYFKPVIYLPNNVTSTANHSLLRSIIGHELAHIKRYDNLWIAFQNGLQILYFFHPAVWIANRRIHLARECICDGMVLRHTDVDRNQYGHDIISILKLNLYGAKGVCLFSGFGKHKSWMIHRLKNLGGKHTMNKNQVLLRYLMIVFLASILIPVSGTRKTPLKASPVSLEQETRENSSSDKSIEQDHQKTELSIAVAEDDVVFIPPLSTGRITAKYGKMMHPYKRKIVFHRGIDIAATHGTEVVASASGTVLSAIEEKEKGKGYGTHLILDHDDGFQTFYAHLDTILVIEGEKIEAGKTVARVGSSGLSTGPHLHFELRQHDKHLDPENYIDFTEIKQR